MILHIGTIAAVSPCTVTASVAQNTLTLYCDAADPRRGQSRAGDADCGEDGVERAAGAARRELAPVVVLADRHAVGLVSKNTNELKTSATSYLSPSARCAPVNGLAGCYVSTIGKPHEYFDLTVRRHKPVNLAGASPA